MINASNLVNFSNSGPAVGDYVYSLVPLSAPSYLPLNSYTTSYLTASYPALSALINTPATSVSYTTFTLAAQNFPGITYGNGTFVVTSQNTNTRTATSSDGITWTERVNLPTTGDWLAVAYGAGVFVTFKYGSAVAASSADNGVTWTSRTLPSTANWYDIAFGAAVFVVVGYGGTAAATSSDGITWTARTLPSAQNWTRVVFGNSLFFAMSADTGVYATSPDGITWTQRTLPVSLRYGTLAFGNGKFVILAGGNSAGTSTDAITWSTKPVGADIPSPSQIAYGNGLYVGVRTTGIATSGMYTYTSTDGLNWIPWVTNVPYIQAIAHGPTGVFAGVPGGGTGTGIRLTPTTTTSSFQLPVIESISNTTAYVKAT